MNFAKRELMKYGWKEGNGLGKEGTGIVDPVRPKLKFDNKGFGYKYGEEYSFNWWEHVYNNAAANVSVNSAEDETSSLSTKNKKTAQICTKKLKRKKKLNGIKYTNCLEVSLQENSRKRNANDIEIEDPCFTCESKNILNEKFGGKLARLLSHEQQFLLNNE